MATAPAYNGGFGRQLLEGRGRVRLSDWYEQYLEAQAQPGRIFEETLTTSQMSVLLQDGLRAIMFGSFAGEPTTWEQVAARETSNKEVETWVELGRLGTLRTVGEGEGYPRVRPELLPARNIRNYKYGDILGISEEMLKFDRTGLIRQLAEDQGARASQTIEEAVYTPLFATANYVKTSADNDVGNNTNATTLSAAGLELAFTTLATMKDPRSGRYLGIRPDTLIVGPRSEFAARQLLFSTQLQRVGPAATSSTADIPANVYGTGTDNVFRGMVRNLIVTPQVARGGNAYNWVLGTAKRGFVMQEVEPLQILQATGADAANEEYLTSDVFRYRVRIWFGVGFTDDRYWYLSSSSTAPTVA